MKRSLLTLLPVAAVIAWALVAAAQPPDRPDGGPPPQDDQQGDGRRGPQSDRSRRGGPPRWQLGTVIPPPIQNQLGLSEDQRQQLRDLEKDVKNRVLKILSDDQKKTLQRLQRRGPGGPPPDSDDDRDRPGRSDGGDRREPPGDRPDRRDPPDGGGTTARMSTDPAIQWFATLESGLKEAQRSGRPILLVSAAPHCAGIPGVW